MSSYKDYKKRALQNPEVKAEYDALQPEYDIIQAMIDARVQQNMTQKDLSAKTGITQADISRIENGTRNPSLSMVKKLAQGLGMQLKLEFVPMPTKIKCKEYDEEIETAGIFACGFSLPCHIQKYRHRNIAIL
mgnify:CR=1 FL=1